MMLFFGSKSKKNIKSIEAKITESNLYMDNNYRDLAKEAYAEASELLSAAVQSGELKPGDVTALSHKLEACHNRMLHMGHY